jgi:hypothetical protein
MVRYSARAGLELFSTAHKPVLADFVAKVVDGFRAE